MELYWKAAGAVLIALVLSQAVQEKDLALGLEITVSTMVGLVLLEVLRPVLDFLRTLQQLGELQGNMLGILMKSLAIAIVTEITEMVCKDGGNSSLGHAMQLLGTGVILWLSLPVFESLIDLIRAILGAI